MSLETILEAIHSASAAQVEEIEAQAEAQAREILDNAHQIAQRMQEQACAAEVLPAYRERSRILQRARLETLRLQGDVREKLVETTLQQARDRLQSFRGEPAYAKALCNLVKQAIQEMEASEDLGGEASLEADPRDQALLNTIFSTMGKQPSIRYDLTCWGGVVARSTDGKVVVVNTFEGRLERAGSYLRHCLGAFFEQGQLKATIQEAG